MGRRPVVWRQVAPSSSGIDHGRSSKDHDRATPRRLDRSMVFVHRQQDGCDGVTGKFVATGYGITGRSCQPDTVQQLGAMSLQAAGRRRATADPAAPLDYDDHRRQQRVCSYVKRCPIASAMFTATPCGQMNGGLPSRLKRSAPPRRPCWMHANVSSVIGQAAPPPDDDVAKVSEILAG